MWKNMFNWNVRQISNLAEKLIYLLIINIIAQILIDFLYKNILFIFLLRFIPDPKPLPANPLSPTPLPLPLSTSKTISRTAIDNLNSMH